MIATVASEVAVVAVDHRQALLVIVATGNHFFLDAAAGALVAGRDRSRRHHTTYRTVTALQPQRKPPSPARRAGGIDERKGFFA